MELKPIIPFEPISTDTLPTSGDWIAQIKWDGVRMLTYFDGHEVRLINRKLNDRTPQYPELLDIKKFCSASSMIIDGEIIAFDQKKPSFHEVMKRDSLRKSQNIDLAVHQTPVTYMLFDILMYNDKWIMDKPLSERQKILQELIAPLPHVQITQSFTDANKLFHTIKEHNMEGIVCKDLGGTYSIGGKDKRWQKKKIFRDLHAVIGGVTTRNGIVNALLLGLYDNNKLVYIGHAGTGKLSAEDWRTLTGQIEPMTIPARPFINEPERNKDAIWIEPKLTVKIQFMEWTPHGTMRHPSIQAFVNVQAAACTFSQNE
ncbi:RNA ligase family protein [Paenibacillus filicis]|uniref:DNA ligase (ATP) n=1 Tax=Paenibacillus filicis TaxID=669464 RepID=A0ABU9DH69_9BACL